MIEKLSHGLKVFNHLLYINPGVESLKIYFFSVHREDSKRQSYFCRTLDGHHLLVDFITLFRFKF